MDFRCFAEVGVSCSLSRLKLQHRQVLAQHAAFPEHQIQPLVSLSRPLPSLTVTTRLYFSSASPQPRHSTFTRLILSVLNTFRLCDLMNHTAVKGESRYALQIRNTCRPQCGAQQNERQLPINSVYTPRANIFIYPITSVAVAAATHVCTVPSRRVHV